MDLAVGLRLAHEFEPLAGVKPAFVAATLISGLAGIWGYVKKSV
jgi:import inner membrane translocase subunit TIM23